MIVDCLWCLYYITKIDGRLNDLILIQCENVLQLLIKLLKYEAMKVKKKINDDIIKKKINPMTTTTTEQLYQQQIFQMV